MCAFAVELRDEAEWEWPVQGIVYFERPTASSIVALERKNAPIDGLADPRHSVGRGQPDLSFKPRRLEGQFGVRDTVAWNRDVHVCHRADTGLLAVCQG